MPECFRLAESQPAIEVTIKFTKENLPSANELISNKKLVWLGLKPFWVSSQPEAEQLLHVKIISEIFYCCGPLKK